MQLPSPFAVQTGPALDPFVAMPLGELQVIVVGLMATAQGRLLDELA